MMFWIYLGIVVLAMVAWIGWNYWRIRRAAKVVSNQEFQDQFHGGQLIDVRTPEEYRKKHIMGARNIPSEQLTVSLGAIRRDRAVLLYDADGRTRVTQVALRLKKEGYTDIFVLESGLSGWTGKVKEG